MAESMLNVWALEYAELYSYSQPLFVLWVTVQWKWASLILTFPAFAEHCEHWAPHLETTAQIVPSINLPYGFIHEASVSALLPNKAHLLVFLPVYFHQQ